MTVQEKICGTCKWVEFFFLELRCSTQKGEVSLLNVDIDETCEDWEARQP